MGDRMMFDIFPLEEGLLPIQSLHEGQELSLDRLAMHRLYRLNHRHTPLFTPPPAKTEE